VNIKTKKVKDFDAVKMMRENRDKINLETKDITSDFGGALPFATISFGDRRKNITFSGGYGAIWQDGYFEGRAITSVAGMIKVSPKISFVFDSFIVLPGMTKTVTDTYQENVYNPSTGNYEYKTITISR
jgi:hypothetical protein